MAGRPPAHPPDELHLERTRARRPRARAVEAAVRQLAATAAAQAEDPALGQGAKVFTLYGDPPARPRPAERIDGDDNDDSLAVGFYRRLARGAA